MSTDAQKRASTNYNRKQDNIMVRPSKEEGAATRAAAAAAGKSVQGYVLEAVREKMERERARAVPGDVPAGSSLHPMPEWGSKEYFEAIKAEAKRREQLQQHGEPKEVRDGDKGPGQFPYFPDGEDTPPVAVGSPPMQNKESFPAEQILPDLEEDNGELPF